MGIFDSIAGTVLDQMAGEKAGTAKMAIEMFNQYGGLTGVLAKFQESGLADVAASWVANGENKPVSSQQVTDALGADDIMQMADKFGINPSALSGQLAEHLPNVVDKMTPNGEVNHHSNDLFKVVMSMMK
ncbi:MAG: YidB family protein [Methylophilaceae bacterium]